MAAPLDADQPGAPGDAVGGALGRVVRDKEVVLGVADQGRRKCLQRVGVHVRVGDKCVEGAAELDDRLGSNTVHPAEIGLGLLGELTHPAAASACRAGLARPGAWRARCPVTR